MAKLHGKTQDRSAGLDRNTVHGKVDLDEGATESLMSKQKRRRVERAVLDSKERYRLIVERAADAMWSVDMNMRPTYMSPSITRLLGYSVQEAMAKPMKEVFTPISFKLVTGLLKEELGIENRDQSDLVMSRTVELELICRDGSLVPVEVKYSFLRDVQGRPVEVLAIARDISGQKQAQKEAKQNTERLIGAMEHAIQAMTNRSRDEGPPYRRSSATGNSACLRHSEGDRPF